jgi:hypothetical protein
MEATPETGRAVNGHHPNGGRQTHRGAAIGLKRAGNRGPSKERLR